MEKVKEYADWVYSMINNPLERRKAWVKEIFETLKKSKGSKKSNPKEIENLTELLNDKSIFDLVGFSANLHYVKHALRKDDEEEDLHSVFVHPWATPKLLFKHKTLPVVIIVGEDLRLDDNVLNEVEKNVKQEVRGFTG